MNIEDIRDYCLQKKAVSEEFPFDSDTLVFKVMGKCFLLTGLDDPELSINLKCDPIRAVRLREQFTSVIPGYHMNKKHWNTVFINGELAESMIRELIDHSYELVVQNLPKRDRMLLDERK